jgi:hypothetical protein
MNRIRLLAFSCFALACSSTSRNQQLENVAKDWSFVIRASQVMPVYPMTEDLFPGDVFLVQSTIDKQQSDWNAKGYLPLDNHIARLVPHGYEEFYANSFDLKNDGFPPKLWLSTTDDSAAWKSAPRAAFPTYSFEAKSGYGLSGALPIQGIPVGLSLLGAKEAYGTVTLSDARTYGTEIESLAAQLKTWAHGQRRFLSSFAPHDGHVNYLRMVNRIYLIGRVAVSIENSESIGAGIEGGVPPPVQLLIPDRPTSATSDAAIQSAGAANSPAAASAQPAASQPAPQSAGAAASHPPGDGGASAGDGTSLSKQAPTASAAAAYGANLQSLNTSLDAIFQSSPLKAGASFKFTAASARSVSLTETFTRPLVIGYLGFDVAIDDDGELGPPIPTYSVVTSGASPRAPRLINNARMETDVAALRNLAGKNDANARRLLDQLDQLGKLVPASIACSLYDSVGKVSYVSGKTSYVDDTPLRHQPPNFDDISTLRKKLIVSVGSAGNAQRNGTPTLEGLPPEAKSLADILRKQVADSRSELDRLELHLEPHAGLFTEADSYVASHPQK